MSAMERPAATIDSRAGIERRIRLAAILIALGLAIEVLSLCWVHALAFMGFLLAGAILVIAGVAWYLLALLQAGAGNT